MSAFRQIRIRELDEDVGEGFNPRRLLLHEGDRFDVYGSL